MGRRRANSRMTEVVRVGVVTEGPPDPLTFEPTRTWAKHYEGAGRVKFPNLASFDRTAGGQQFTEQTLMLHIPATDGHEIQTDDIAEVFSSTADPSLVGRTFRITGRPQGGQTTAHRYPVEELS
ncbi:DUF6093 family protein [Mycetocola tolaasinivorans]|nr:DUF6093 family protein [Mycetocola tolaasinivorans]